MCFDSKSVRNNETKTRGNSIGYPRSHDDIDWIHVRKTTHSPPDSARSKCPLWPPVEWVVLRSSRNKRNEIGRIKSEWGKAYTEVASHKHVIRGLRLICNSVADNVCCFNGRSRSTALTANWNRNWKNVYADRCSDDMREEMCNVPHTTFLSDARYVRGRWISCWGYRLWKQNTLCTTASFWILCRHLRPDSPVFSFIHQRYVKHYITRMLIVIIR